MLRRSLMMSVVMGSGFASAESITVGETEIPLGDDGFADVVECLNLDDGCSDVSPLGGPPNFPFLPWFSGLNGTYLLDVVVPDLDIDDEIRLSFSTPIENQPGDDVYLAQARFISSGLGTFDQNVNDFHVRFGDGGSWHVIGAGAFAEDVPAGLQSMWYIEDEIQSSFYELWYETIDLSDLGLAPGETIEVMFIRGPTVPAFPETAGLDVVTVANMNEVPFRRADLDGDGDVDTTDLLEMLASWGDCPEPCPPSCAADITGPGGEPDCAVNVTDLLLILGDWG